MFCLAVTVKAAAAARKRVGRMNEEEEKMRDYVEVSEGGWLNIHSKREWLSPKITSGREATSDFWR